ncbi:polysaccharide export protein [Pirellula staleyi DSM 6068]|uniref:Polysaccharide export protein n=1 Tax=Pirellula staleyi (strain ATCC 27377 / DSM 6068 / ICPB 4128) TaxID=530564 RepID=D2R0W6_PIRSD|nr:polysaccharide biosynthesis/export family protein [Pirellula staleyi]ADB16714.1 polysaccharide export protein [Pirellula staleyi DSM 6068]
MTIQNWFRRRLAWAALGSLAAGAAIVASMSFVRSLPQVATLPAEVRVVGGESPLVDGAWLSIDARDAGEVKLCQFSGSMPCGDGCEVRIDGVDCRMGNGCGEPGWDQWNKIPWQAFGAGEYVGPARTAAIPEYRLRTDDQIEFIYRLTREATAAEYQLEVGDSIKVESLIDPALDRDVVIQPDGTITLRLLGQIRVAGKTINAVQMELEEKYKKYYKVTELTLTPVKTNTRLEDLRAAVDSRFFSGGQGKLVRVTPEGTISLPAIGVVMVQNLSLEEVKREVDERYAQIVDGLEVTPILQTRAPRFIYVLGEVRQPGRFSLEAPTTAMQSIALAGGWNNGGNLRQIVVFRRGEDWRLLATKLDLRGALYGTRPAPSDEIWLRDSDVVVVPATSLKRANDVFELVFTNGVYRVFPISFSYQFGTGSTL